MIQLKNIFLVSLLSIALPTISSLSNRIHNSAIQNNKFSLKQTFAKTIKRIQTSLPGKFFRKCHPYIFSKRGAVLAAKIVSKVYSAEILFNGLKYACGKIPQNGFLKKINTSISSILFGTANLGQFIYKLKHHDNIFSRSIQNIGINDVTKMFRMLYASYSIYLDITEKSAEINRDESESSSDKDSENISHNESVINWDDAIEYLKNPHYFNILSHGFGTLEKMMIMLSGQVGCGKSYFLQKFPALFKALELYFEYKEKNDQSEESKKYHQFIQKENQLDSKRQKDLNALKAPAIFTNLFYQIKTDRNIRLHIIEKNIRVPEIEGFTQQNKNTIQEYIDEIKEENRAYDILNNKQIKTILDGIKKDADRLDLKYYIDNAINNKIIDLLKKNITESKITLNNKILLVDNFSNEAITKILDDGNDQSWETLKNDSEFKKTLLFSVLDHLEKVETVYQKYDTEEKEVLKFKEDNKVAINAYKDSLKNNINDEDCTKFKAFLLKKGINTAKDVIKQPYCAFTGSLENKFYGGSQIKTVRLFKTLQRLAEEPQNCINGKIILFADELEGLLGTINDNRSHNANQRSVLLRELDTCLKSGKVLIVGGTNMIKNMDSAVQRRAHNILFGVESTELIKAFASNQQLIKDKDELLQKTAVKLAQSILSGIPPAQEISQEEHIAKLILENDSFTIKVPDSMKKQASIIAASYERINEKNQIIFKKRTIPLDHKITVKTLKDNDYLQYVLNTLLPQYSLISSPAAVEDRFAREYDACVQMVQALFTIFKFDAQKVFAFLKLYYKDLKNKNYVVKETNVVSNDVYWKFADENLDAVLDYYQKYISSSRRDNHEDYFKDFINMLKKTKDPREGLYKELFVNNKKFLEYSKAAFESIHNNVLENKQQFDNARKNILEDPSYKKTVKSFSALSKEFQKMFGEDTSLSFIGAISGIAKKMNQLPWIIEAEEKDDTYIFTLVPRTDESYKKEGAEYIEKITSLASEYLSTNDLKLISHNNIYPDSELIEHITSKNIGIFSEPE